MAFYSNAQQLGVTELLLPIVVLGAGNITKDDPREEVRLIDSLQYENIEAAWLAGYDSGEWRAKMTRLAVRLDNALHTTEAALSSAIDTPPSGVTPDAEGDPDVDLFAVAQQARDIDPLLQETLNAVKRFFEVATEDLGGEQHWESMSPGQQNARLLATATHIKSPSLELETRGNELLASTSKFDADMRALVSELRTIGHESTTKMLSDLLNQMSGVENTTETEAQMDSMIAMLKTAGLLNVHLRKAIRPGINGLQAVKTALATVSSWNEVIVTNV